MKFATLINVSTQSWGWGELRPPWARATLNFSTLILRFVPAALVS